MNKRPLRVLQLIDHMGVGGAQDVVLDLLREMPSLGVQCEVATIFSDDANRAELCALAPWHDLGTGATYSPIAAADPRLVWRLNRFLRANTYDVVHVHLYVVLAYLTVFRHMVREQRVIATVHTHRASSPSWVFDATVRAKRVVDYFCPVLQGIGDDLRAGGVPEQLIRPVPLGTRTISPEPPEDLAAYRQELGLSGSGPIFLSLARLHTQRHLDKFLRAFAAVPQGNDRPELILAGTGPEEQSLRQLADELGVADRVAFPGYRRDHAQLFAAADVYCSLSLEGRDVGMAAIQACLAGLPVTCWDATGVTVDKDELNGERVALTAGTVDDLTRHLQLLLDPSERSLVAEHGHAIAQKTGSARAMAERYAALYTSD